MSEAPGAAGQSQAEARAVIEAARKHHVPSVKLAALHEPGELKARVESVWTNIGILSAFICSISITVMTADTGPTFGKAVMFVSYLSFLVLAIAVVLITTNLFHLNYCPDACVVVRFLGRRAALPSLLCFVGILLLCIGSLLLLLEKLGQGPSLWVAVGITCAFFLFSVHYTITTAWWQIKILNQGLDAKLCKLH
mmetsp:Transcript_62849/g.142022  ORF Transcript_62849/g.142022 Transcript_62849/m.142022 type:complete len:195 (+) Transcript_62849:81-665(+)